MDEGSKLTPEVLALAGRRGPASKVVVSARVVRKALDVWGQAGEALPSEGEAVPSYVVEALGSEAEGLALPSLMPNDLLISNEILLERPLRLGEELTLQTRVADISERFGGRFGQSLYLRSDVELTDASGAVVARSVRTMMQYDARNASGGLE
ncbi:MAG: hypothetical protein ACKVVT_11780 [Dehalococcoidia bacterium]